MVNAGLVKATVVDDYMARFWKQMLPGITLHPTRCVARGRRLALGRPQEQPEADGRAERVRQAHGRAPCSATCCCASTCKSTKFVKSATSDGRAARGSSAWSSSSGSTAAEYDIDYLLMVAQGYQESRLDQNAKSQVGAIGVMQVMPATGKELKVGDIRQVEANIHAGVKYIRFMIDKYFKDEPMDALNKGLFAFASYNAGPAASGSCARRPQGAAWTPTSGSTTSSASPPRTIGRETVTYVSNIYKYYVAYTLTVDEMAEKAKARSTVGEK